MPNFFLPFCSFCFLVLGTPQATLAQHSVPESEKLRFEAQVARDTAALTSLLSDDLVYIHSNALVESKTDFLRSVGGGGIRYLDMRKLEGGAVSIWGKTALSQGMVEVRGLYQGNEFQMTLRFTSIYRKEKGIWRLYSWQSTRVP